MKNIFAVILALASFAALAQDPQFSQYYQAPLYLNAGFTGTTADQRLVFNHRLQWPGVPQAFSTYAASYDKYVPTLSSGFGFMVTTDKMGSAGWRTTTINALYSYKLKLTETIVFSPGLSFGYGSNGLDRSKLRMADGLQYEGMSLDPQLNSLRTQRYFDFSSGFVLYTPHMWLGASFAHMNRPNLSLIGEESRLGMKTAIHGGLRMKLRSAGYRARTPYITPSFIFRLQDNMFSQLDLGMNFHIDPVSIGAWYRGKPFTKSIINSIEQDALIFVAGLNLKNLAVGYSYDFTISELQTAPGGSHEISITYEFAPRKNDKKHHRKLIPCPAFYSKR
jgi:type IX secretion system PorP/SprF family membrane protein